MQKKKQKGVGYGSLHLVIVYESQRLSYIIRSKRPDRGRVEYATRPHWRFINVSVTVLLGSEDTLRGGGWIHRQRSPQRPTFRPSLNKGRRKGPRCMCPHRTISVPNCFTALQGTTSKLLSVSRCRETTALNEKTGRPWMSATKSDEAQVC